MHFSMQESISLALPLPFLQTFKKMKLPQIRDPNLFPEGRIPEAYHSKIAVIGCGPAGISCATFLGRLGYTDVTVFERERYMGGLR